MMKLRYAILPLLLAMAIRAFGQNLLSLATTYTHTCDASAAVALDADRFVVANDEDNVLRIYRRSQPGPPVSTLDVSSFLRLIKKGAEADLEGAARVGDRIYWISSHGLPASGKASPDRHRLFATDIRVTKSEPALVPVGQPYVTLVRDLIREPRLSRFKLARAAATDPRKAGTLDIEGLAATPHGHLLIGFRTPIPQGKALVIPLLNPASVVAGKPPSFGEAILLDLDGLGIRGFDFHDGQYWIIAGHHDNKTPARLYRWAGGAAVPEWQREVNLAGFNPEALFFPEDTAAGTFFIISDDGGVSIGGSACKDLKDANLKRFRMFPVNLPASSAGK